LRKAQELGLERNREKMLSELGGKSKEQELDLERSREEMLSKLGSKLNEQYLEDLNETYEFREAPALSVEPRGVWNVKSSAGKEKMGYTYLKNVNFE
ncbi:4501_t:CDS:1, partial [Racocetra fulgida]